MSTMLRIPLYYKRYGVRRPGQIMTPRMFPLHTEQLPRNAVLHYLSDTRAEIGPRSDDNLLSKTKKVNYIQHVTEFVSDVGNPRPTFKLPNPMIMDYRRKNRKIRPVAKIENAIRDPQSVLIINYSILPHMRRYLRNRKSAYHEWYNLQSTIYSGMAGMLHLETDNPDIAPRNQFLEVRLPDKLPSIGVFRQGTNGLSRRVMEEFTTNEAFTLLDLWRWVGPTQDQSLLSEFIQTEDLNRVYFIFRSSTSWLVVNLGILDSWIKRDDGEGEGVDPLTFQLRFYRFLTKFYDTDMLQTADDDIEAVPDEDDDVPDRVEDAVLTVPVKVAKVPVKTRTAPDPAGALAGDPVVEDDDEDDIVDEARQDLIDELRRLDEMDEEMISTTLDEIQDAEELELSEELDYVDEEVETPFDDDDEEFMAERETIVASNGIVGPGMEDAPDGAPVDFEVAIISKAAELSSQRVITEPQFRRMEAAAKQYKTLENPFNPKETIEKAITRPKERLRLKPDTVPDMVEVLDKTLLTSTVEASNRHYVENVLEDDMVSMVMAVQQSPVAVTSYETEKVKDAVSDYTLHRVHLQPVTGKPSRIEFRTPNVQPNGVFISNGTKYRLRPQRGDLPIVKISEHRVALSSYYGKAMVERSQKSRHDYDKWLGEALVTVATDESNPIITDAVVVNSSVLDRKLPRIYNVISRRLSSFTSNGYKYQFAYNSRDFDPEALKRLERGGRQVVVASRGNSYIVMDYGDVFYKTDLEGNLEPLGLAEDLFGLPDKRPLPMVELKIFGKDIPVGVALAYLWGLDGLLRRIGAKPRRVAVGERVQLDKDEYAIVFKDETLVFDRTDYRTALFMVGFDAYRKTIRQYNYGEFNRKVVYGAVLEQHGIHLRYIRELDMMSALFIDPITRDLLEWMKEPTDFKRLLVRAVDMLLLPYVPKTVKGADDIVSNLERTKGYERFAGVIYNELIKSMRQYNTRNITTNSTISMNPHAVWTRIVTDGAATVVNELNPIENLKEIEVITYGGDGGRSKRAMTAETRLYRETDLGAISEATPDSADVGITAYRPPNPVETTVRGTVRAMDPKTDGASSLFSTSALLAPGAERDDQMC